MKKSFFIFLLLSLCPSFLWAANEKLIVVTSFSVIADWAKNILGEEGEVVSIVPMDADNHAYSPIPSDVTKIENADLLIAISPQFETWLPQISKNFKDSKKILFLGRLFYSDEDATCACGHAHHNHSKANSENTNDTHFWTDPILVKEKVIPEILKKIKSIDKRINIEQCEKNAKEYSDKIDLLHKEILKLVDKIPFEQRQLVTYHNNMQYFAKRYGFKNAGVIIESATTEVVDPSAKKIAALIKKIKSEKILAVFTDNTVANNLAKAIANDAGIQKPIVLCIDALSQKIKPAVTYIGMIQENARLISEALTVSSKK